MNLNNLHLSQLQAEIGRRSLYDFYKQAWGILEPTTAYQDAWFIEYMCEYLELVAGGKIKRLCVNIWPRSGKSGLISVVFPVWNWLRQPGNRFLFTSFSQTLSTKHSTDRRTLIQSPWFQERHGSIFTLAGDNNLKTEFSNNHRGHMISTSVGGSAIGRGGNILVADDPLNPIEALSDLQRNNCNNWLKHSFFTRLDNKDNDALILVQQRLHESDPVGTFVDDSWTHIKIPAIAQKNKEYIFPKSGKKVHVKEGDVLSRESLETLNKLKSVLGSYQFSNQYLQEGSPIEGGLIKNSWWKRFDKPPSVFDLIIQSWDLAFGDHGAYTVGLVIGMIGARRYLLDEFREKVDFPKMLNAIIEMKRRYPATDSILVEAKAAGTPLIDTLKNEISGIVPIEPIGDKQTRLFACSGSIEAGNCYLPNEPWADDFILELGQFPNARYKDRADAFSQALNKYRELDDKIIKEWLTQEPVMAEASFSMDTDTGMTDKPPEKQYYRDVEEYENGRWDW